jgi:hypothetical protein
MILPAVLYEDADARMLPDFRVIELWSDDVLLENRRLQA